MDKLLINQMKTNANRIRVRIINACLNHGDGHAGSSLSCADILSVLYTDILRVDVKAPKSPT
ncbi:MAG: hypothetical protein WCI62_04245, partial [Erysipelotrichaceae bacterium]